MSLISSNMLPLGSLAPDFKLLDTVTDTNKSLQELKGEKGTLILFICNHCPYVVHIDKALAKLSKDYKDSGISIVAISSNDIDSYPQDGPIAMGKKAEILGYNFPYLFDETQKIAKAYKAECTPDLFLFDSELLCVYRGQFDDSRPGNGIDVTGDCIRGAMDSLLKGKAISEKQKASIGCNIKWKESFL